MGDEIRTVGELVEALSSINPNARVLACNEWDEVRGDYVVVQEERGRVRLIGYDDQVVKVIPMDGREQYIHYIYPREKRAFCRLPCSGLYSDLPTTDTIPNTTCPWCLYNLGLEPRGTMSPPESAYQRYGGK